VSSQAVMTFYIQVISLYDRGYYDKLNNLDSNHIRDTQDRLAPVLELFEASAKSYPTEAALHMNKLGAVLVRLSFLLHCNRHETPQEFSELIGLYKISNSTLQINVADLI